MRRVTRAPKAVATSMDAAPVGCAAFTDAHPAVVAVAAVGMEVAGDTAAAVAVAVVQHRHATSMGAESIPTSMAAVLVVSALYTVVHDQSRQSINRSTIRSLGALPQ